MKIDSCNGEYKCIKKSVIFYFLDTTNFSNLMIKNIFPFGRCEDHVLEGEYCNYYSKISYEEAIVYEIMQS